MSSFNVGFDRTPERRVARIESHAEALMDDPVVWAGLESVTKALIEHTTPDGARVEAVLLAANPGVGEGGSRRGVIGAGRPTDRSSDRVVCVDRGYSPYNARNFDRCAPGAID